MKKTRTGIIVALLIMLIGFAAVSTTLVLNGTAIFGTNTDDFDVIFTKSVIDGVDVSGSSISEDGKSLTFSTGNLAIKDDTSVLNFTVMNNSTQYDAKVAMECTADGENASKYYTITNTIPEVIEAKRSVDGSVTATLTKSSVEEITETFTCTISTTAVERTEVGERKRSEIVVTATDENNNDLNAKAYEIDEEEKTTLLESLVETGYVANADEVDVLIEVESNDFENIADTTFDLSPIANSGDTVIILHFNESTQEWEYIGTEVVDEDGKVNADFTSYSPVAFVVVKDDGTYEVVEQDTIRVLTGDGKSAGNIISIGNQRFYVISNDGTSVKLLSEMLVDYTTNLQSVNKATTVFSTYDYKGENYSDYEGSKIQGYVDSYSNYLKSTYEIDNQGTLITIEELVNLGCLIIDDNTISCVDSPNTWIYDTLGTISYWTRTAKNDAVIWAVHPEGTAYAYSYASSYGVRPVITISSSMLN